MKRSINVLLSLLIAGFSGAMSSVGAQAQQAPMCLANAVSDPNDATAITLNAVRPFSTTLVERLDYTWRNILKPESALLRWPQGHTDPIIRVEGLVFGDYTFLVEVTDDDGRTTQCSVTHSVIPPADQHTPAPADIPYSVRLNRKLTRARVSLRDPGGKIIDEQTCSSSPCIVSARDMSQGTHLIKADLLSVIGEVVEKGAWEPVVLEVPSPRQSSFLSTIVGNLPHIKTWMPLYSQPKGTVLSWLSQRFDLFVASHDPQAPDPRLFNPTVTFTGYKDNQTVYAFEDTWDIALRAAALGVNQEQYYSHMDVDYVHSNRWTNMHRFDGFDKPGGLYKNGVITFNGVSFFDKTEQAFSSTANDVSISNTVYIGYGLPFDQIRFLLSRARAGGTFKWEYWNGTKWNMLQVRQDDTLGLGASPGSMHSLVFTPPNDWARTTVNGSRSKWWIRFVVTNATVTPIASRIIGDTWLTGTLSRGWAANNAGRILCCGGAYEYDPNPPTNATARFKHQARVRSFWPTSNDAFLINQSASHNGKRLWADYMVWHLPKYMKTRGFNAMALDNGDSIIQTISKPSDWRAHMDWQEPYIDDIIASYKDIVDGVHAAIPGAKIGANCLGDPRFAMIGDIAFLENFSSNRPGEHNFNHLTRPVLTFDDFLPANNPSGTRGAIMVMDNAVGNNGIDAGGAAMDGVDQKGQYFVWDKRDRRPIAALAFYYIGANENTLFHYNAFGFTYSQTDEVRVHTETTTRLAAPIARDLSTSNKTIHLQDATGFGSGNVIIQLGDASQQAQHTGEHILYDSRSATVLTHNDPVYNDWPAGTEVNVVSTARQSGLYPTEKVCYYANWFPAMGIDIGVPDVNGHNGGLRDILWVRSSTIGDGGTNVWRRDFTRAIVLLRPAMWNTTASRFNTFRGPFQLGATYYRLRANGTTDPTGINAIELREGEGAILLKQPIVKSHR